jgi:hypothetical protein
MKNETLYVENMRNTALELTPEELAAVIQDDRNILKRASDFCAKTRMRAALRLNVYRSIILERQIKSYDSVF